MNWLRNPYGLCNWAEDNFSYALANNPHLAGKPKKPLWYVVNHWNYEKSRRVNRPLFKSVVDDYAAVILGLPQAYFFFDVASFMSFVLPNMDALPTKQTFGSSIRIEGNVFHEQKVGIPMEYFSKPQFHLGHASLEAYKDWFRQLIEFANLLQDEEYVFYCDN